MWLDINQPEPIKRTMETANRHKAVRTSLCGCQADNANGISDKHRRRIPTEVLTSEKIPTSHKFAKW